MTTNKIICPYCESSVPSGAAFMHSCGKIWYPFSETKNTCPQCNKEENLIKCPYCKGPSTYENWLNQADILKKEALKREEELKNRKGFDWLEKIIDNALEKIKSEGFMKTPGAVPKEMAVEQKSEDDWKEWKPIKSTLNDAILDAFETKFKVKLPLSYRHFLKHKHFFELSLENRLVTLPSHLPNRKLDEIIGQDIHHIDFIKNGFIYFAYYQDSAYLCFDTNDMDENGECPIVAFDHEQFYLPEQVKEEDGNCIYHSFEELLLAKDKSYYGA